MNVKQILHISIGPVGAAALSLITIPVVTWFFTIEDVGRLTMLQVVIGLGVSVFSLAMHQAYVREYHENDDKPSLLKAAITPGIILLTVAFSALLFSPVPISLLLFGLESTWLTVLLGISVVSSFLINFLTHILRMEERGLAFSLTQILPKFALLFFIGTIFFFDLSNDFIVLMTMNTTALTISLFTFLWLTKLSWISALKSSLNIKLMKKMLLFSLPLVVGSLAYWGLTTMDRFFLRALSGFAELGIYAVAVTLAGAVSVLSTIFSNLWHPVVYKWVKEGVDSNRIQQVIENMVLLVTFVWSLAGLFSWIIIYLLPEEYKAVEYLIVASIAMPLFYMLSETTVVGIGITRRTSYAMLASIVAFILNAGLNYLLIPNFGASGAAVATVIAFFVFFAVRTEASAILWKSLPRFKVYIITSAYVITTCIMVLTQARFDYFFIVWLALFSLSVFMFFTTLQHTFIFLRNIIIGII